MAEDRQPQNVVEGAAGDVEDEVPAAKSAEDRKAADALSKLDNRADDDAAGGSKDVDQDAVNRALGGGKTDVKKDTKKIKIDAADVTLIVSCCKYLISEGRKLTDNSCVCRWPNSM
jgi:hypothetical protein